MVESIECHDWRRPDAGLRVLRLSLPTRRSA